MFLHVKLKFHKCIFSHDSTQVYKLGQINCKCLWDQAAVSIYIMSEVICHHGHCHPLVFVRFFPQYVSWMEIIWSIIIIFFIFIEFNDLNVLQLVFLLFLKNNEYQYMWYEHEIITKANNWSVNDIDKVAMTCMCKIYFKYCNKPTCTCEFFIYARVLNV